MMRSVAHSVLGILQVQLDSVARQRSAREHWDPLTLICCCYTMASAAKIRPNPSLIPAYEKVVAASALTPVQVQCAKCEKEGMTS